MTKHPELFAALAAPFGPNEVKSYSASGRRVSYITARTAMNRLDDVLGPENWWDSYRPGGESSVICALSARLPDGSVVTKEDAGGAAGMADAGDDDKSTHTDAFKRAAVKFGVARYLYGDGVPAFARERRKPDPLPAPKREPAHAATVNGNGHAPAPAAPTAGRTNVNGRPHAGPPQTGKQLFAWLKDQEQLYEVGLIKYLASWGKLQDFPGKVVEWNPDQARLGHAEAVRKIGSLRSTDNEHDQADGHGRDMEGR